MARARNLKPSFFTDDELAEVAPLGRLLFQGLWCMADREGRLEDRPKKIKAEILPYDNCVIERLLGDLAQRRYIIRYEIDGDRFIQVRQFKKHQNPHVKEPLSTIPAPGDAPLKHSASTGQAPPFPERAGRIPDSGFPLPDSSALIPPSGPRLADPGPPDSGLPQPESGQPSAPKINGADEKIARSTAKSTAGQEWDSEVWVNATATTVEITRRQNEAYLDYRDRVYAAVQAKRAKAKLQAHGRQAAA